MKHQRAKFPRPELGSWRAGSPRWERAASDRPWRAGRRSRQLSLVSQTESGSWTGLRPIHDSAHDEP